MSVSAKLSRTFHEVFGEEAADIMVDWMHDTEGGRAELRELNDLSFSRFDARLGERIAEVNAKVDVLAASIDGRFEALEPSLKSMIDRRLAEQTRWLIGLWLATMISIGGVLITLARAHT